MTETIEATRTSRAPRGRKAGPVAGGTAEGPEERPRRAPRGTQPLVIGGVPRVDLLPSEVHVHRRQRATVRRAWAGVVLVALVVGIGAGAASLARSSAADDLATAQAETLSLQQQQQQFRDVRTTESSSALLESAQTVGGATEIDWSETLAAVKAKLPAGVAITGVTIDSATAEDPYPQSDDPLQPQRVATVTLDATSATLPSVPAWITALGDLRGFADATADSVTKGNTSGDGYTVTLTIHLDEKAYDDRYATKKD